MRRKYPRLPVLAQMFLLFVSSHFATQSSITAPAGRPSQLPPPPSPQRQQQRPATTPGAAPSAPAQNSSFGEDDGEVVRITSNLVQIDVVVTDPNGRQVSGLGPEDFELFEDNRPQRITNFAYVANEPPRPGAMFPPRGEAGASAAGTPVRSSGSSASAAAARRLPPEQVRRTIALVIDDLGASAESTAYIRRALKKYIDEQMQPNDLVAIVRTSAGAGALQQFTSDKRRLAAAIERVRWYPRGRGGVSAVAPLESDPLPEGREMALVGGGRGRTPLADIDGGDGVSDGGATAVAHADLGRERVAGEADVFRDELFSVGTLGALNFIVAGLRELPGRKSIVMFSDGFRIFTSGGRNDRLLRALRRVTDLANRASVVIYTIDARGTQTRGLTAADDTSALSPEQLVGRLHRRDVNYFHTQDGLNYLAQQTGGFFVHNGTDISDAVRRILDDQKGYYLIGYRPNSATFDSAGGRTPFHTLTVRMKRPGLAARTRGGFYGLAEASAAAARAPSRRTRHEQLLAALSSPFASGKVGLRLTSMFSADDAQTSHLSSLLHIDAKNLTFTPEPERWHKAVIDVIALTYGADGAVVNQVNRTETIRARDEAYTDLLKHGLVYPLQVPIKTPGAYQLRVAVRDAGSERIGSASQFVEVPDLGRKRLALSSIVLMSSDMSATTLPATMRPANVAKGGGGDAETREPDPAGGPAVRRFRRGSAIDYFYTIYNAKPAGPYGGSSRRRQDQPPPPIRTEVTLLRENQPVYASQTELPGTSRQKNMKPLRTGGRIQLGLNLQPGEYVLQVAVTDALASEEARTVTQWIDFEIVK